MKTLNYLHNKKKNQSGFDSGLKELGIHLLHIKTKKKKTVKKSA
jgi:hypothetical protein